MNISCLRFSRAAYFALLSFATYACGGDSDSNSKSDVTHSGGSSAASSAKGGTSGNGESKSSGGSQSSLPGSASSEIGGNSGGGANSGGATSIPNTGGAPTAGTERYASVDEGVFPQDRVLRVEITLPDGAWENLIQNATAEEYIGAKVTIDQQDLGEIGLRFKGSWSLNSCVDETGSLICDKLSLKLKFNEIDKEKRFYGLKRLNFNNLVEGGAVPRERLAYQLFRDMGITAPRTSYAVVKVNGKSEGIYTVVEEVDGRFTADRYDPGDGNLYKEAWPDHTDDSYFDSQLETNTETASHQSFKSFAADMIAADDSNLPQTLSKWMDLDYLARYMAVDYAIANWDGITTFYCGDWGCGNHNFYIYQNEIDQKFQLIVWDLNAVFAPGHWLGNIVPWDTLDADCENYVPTADGTIATRPAACDPTIRAIALNRDAYHAAVRKLLDEKFVLDRLNSQIDQVVTLVTPALADDPYVSATSLKSGARYLKQQIATLRTRLEAVVN